MSVVQSLRSSGYSLPVSPGRIPNPTCCYHLGANGKVCCCRGLEHHFLHATLSGEQWNYSAIQLIRSLEPLVLEHHQSEALALEPSLSATSPLTTSVPCSCLRSSSLPFGINHHLDTRAEPRPVPVVLYLRYTATSSILVMLLIAFFTAPTDVVGQVPQIFLLPSILTLILLRLGAFC